MRYVPWTKLRKDENGNILGILGTAFALRPNEESLSATWIEYFPGTIEDQKNCAIYANRSNFNIKPKSGFAVGKVGAILATCNERNSHKKTRIVYTPNKNNSSHAEVKSLSQDDTELLELLALDAWADRKSVV